MIIVISSAILDLSSSPFLPTLSAVMGAVIDPRSEPLLVLEHCEFGSLYDLLHNETISIDGEVLLPIIRDVVSGVRFLHSSKPQIVHGDLKVSEHVGY